MIEDLTKEKLIEYKFKNETIERLLTWENYETVHFIKDFYCYWASNIEGKIYSGEDAARKYFLEKRLISFPFSCYSIRDEYFEKKLSKYIDGEIEIQGTGINKVAYTKLFIENEKKFASNEIEYLNKSPIKFKELGLKSKAYKGYIIFLETKIEEVNKPATNRAHKNQIIDFNMLFKNIEWIEPCIDLLKETDKPCIDDDNEYLGGSKGVFIVWFNALMNRGMIDKTKIAADRESRAIILNKNFKNLNISGSSFKDKNETATKNYKATFENEMLMIKTK